MADEVVFLPCRTLLKIWDSPAIRVALVVYVADENFFEAIMVYRPKVLYRLSLDRQNSPQLTFLGASLYLEGNAEICVEQVIVFWLVEHVLQVGFAPQIQLLDSFFPQL